MSILTYLRFKRHMNVGFRLFPSVAFSTSFGSFGRVPSGINDTDFHGPDVLPNPSGVSE